MDCKNCAYKNRIKRTLARKETFSVEKGFLYCLKTGYIKEFNCLQNGNYNITNIFKPQDIIGYNKSYYNENTVYEALTPITFYEIYDPNFISNNYLLQKCFKCLGNINNFHNQLLSITSYANNYKVTKLLDMLYEYYGDNNCIPFKLTHQDLASILGITRESVSRSFPQDKYNISKNCIKKVN